MKQCETCVDKEYKDKYLCCMENQLAHATRELLKCIPLVGKNIPEYECKGYENGGDAQ